MGTGGAWSKFEPRKGSGVAQPLRRAYLRRVPTVGVWMAGADVKKFTRAVKRAEKIRDFWNLKIGDWAISAAPSKRKKNLALDPNSQ